eukprot:scaffold113217_cov17-Tisochrysis_lutea.AAC.1
MLHHCHDHQPRCHGEGAGAAGRPWGWQAGTRQAGAQCDLHILHGPHRTATALLQHLQRFEWGTHAPPGHPQSHPLLLVHLCPPQSRPAAGTQSLGLLTQRLCRWRGRYPRPPHPNPSAAHQGGAMHHLRGGQ